MLAKLRILPRLLVGFGVLVLLITLLSGLSIYSGHASKMAFQEMDRFQSAETVDLEAEVDLFRIRMTIWQALAMNDQAAWTKASSLFRQIQERIDLLRSRTSDPDRLARVRELSGALTIYEDASARLRSFQGGNQALTTGDGPAAVAAAMQAGAAVAQIAEPLAQAYNDASNQATQRGEQLIDGLLVVSATVGVISIISGVVLSLLIGRSIVNPIQGLTRLMGRLANKEMSVTIDQIHRRDEVGDMAAAVQVFKDNMIRADQLALEQEAERAAKEKRAQVVEKLVNGFEAQIAGMVEILAAASTE
ncbi:methyl-accepting chemotaxis protein, partial [Acetobacteraceae bacterium KSS8]|nr:methyl-accepting chemotaxis protein [Acetobacteraceae bacterium KSS8]